jgi:PAS domain S-box-containing protein
MSQMLPAPMPPAMGRAEAALGADLSIAARDHVTIDRAPVGIAHFDRQGRFLFVNPQLCSLFGFSREELLAMTFQEISFAEELPLCMAMIEQLTDNTIPKFTHEKRFERRDGSFVYTRVIVSAVRDDSGGVAFFLGVVEDLSEQWAIDQARKAAEARLSLALEASGTGIYRYDFRQQALDWAHNLANVFGFPEGQELQSLERLLGAIHPDDLPEVVKAYEKSATEGADFDHEFRIVRPDGGVRWISDRARMSLDADGTPRYLTGACIDVTARRDALSREHVARADADRAIRSRDEVLAVVAHDLRNPVHTILMSVAVAELPTLPAADRAKQLAVIRRTARAMDHLIRDLLDVTQIEMGQLAIERLPLAIDALVEEAVTTFGPRAADRKLRLTADVARNLPVISADRERLSQVLNNLIGNALKFTPDGGAIMIGAHPVGNAVEIVVADTGCGIAPAELPNVFRRYWQADSGAHRGVGLGLAIVHGIIEAHGGQVAVESTVGAGTTFRVTLPA